MNDLFERIDAFTARSTRSVGAALLVECKAMITDLRPVAQDWLPIATLPFPIHLGDHAKTEHPVWLADVASGVVRTGRPTRRRRPLRVPSSPPTPSSLNGGTRIAREEACQSRCGWDQKLWRSSVGTPTPATPCSITLAHPAQPGSPVPPGPSQQPQSSAAAQDRGES